VASQCSKRWTIEARDQRYLWATSGGFCANPDCHSNLFADVEDEKYSFGELAHVVAAGDAGPRHDGSVSGKERAEVSNIILLCSNCHTIVDKASESYPVETLLGWKRSHVTAISELFEVPVFSDRPSARAAVEPLLKQNAATFGRYGPGSAAVRNRFDREPVTQWRRKVQEIILPNNRRILSICDKNANLLLADEPGAVEDFRNHVDDFEARHYRLAVEPGGEQFPAKISEVFFGDGS
jgi:hypothetical protein